MAENNNQTSASSQENVTELHRIIKLFTNKHTCELYERHIQAVDSIARKYKDGFQISDLPQVARIISLACDSILLGHVGFVEPLCEVLNVCGKDFIQSRANEMFRSKDIICDMIVVMASMMLCAPPRVCMAAASALQHTFEMKDFRDAEGTPAAVGIPTDGEKNDLRPNQWSFNQQVVDRSGVIKIIVASLRKLLETVENEKGGVEEKPEISLREDETVWDAADQLKPSESERNRLLHLEVLRCGICLVRELSFSPANARTLIKEGVPLICIHALDIADDFKDRLVSNCIDIIWNLLETSSNELMNRDNIARSRAKLIEKRRSTNCLRVLGVPKSLNVLRRLLEQSLVSGFRAVDKELRNNVLVVASILARHKENHVHFITSGLLDLLLLYACAPEIGLPAPAETHNYGTKSQFDFELKRLMWQLISDLCMVENDVISPITQMAHKVVSQMPITETLLMYVDHNSLDHRALKLWSAPQLRVLRIDACGLLGVLLRVNECATKFVESDGPRLVLNFLQKVTASPLAQMLDETTQPQQDQNGDSMNNSSSNNNLAQGQSYMTLGAQTTQTMSKESMIARSIVHDTELELAAVRLLSHCSALPEAAIVSHLGSNGAVGTLLNLFQADLGDDMAAIELRTQTVNAIGNLCDPKGGNIDGKVNEGRVEPCKENQDNLRRAGGIMALKSALVYDPLMPASAEVLLMMVVDAVWRSVVGNRKSEVRFIDIDGVDALLDLMEQAPASMHRQILGCISDLVRNRRAKSYFRAWRSSTSMRGAAVILLRMWSAEELRLRIKNGEKGMLANLDAPLQGDVRPAVLQQFNPRAPESSGNVEDGEDEDDMDGYSNEPEEGKLDRKGEPTLEEELGSLTGEAKRSKLYKRLRRALAAAKDITLFNKSDPGSIFKTAAEAKDLRMLVWSVFESVEWDNLGLENDDACDDVILIALQCCRHYREFKLGESWTQVRQQLTERKITPIKPDALLMEVALENSYNAAMETKYEQSKLVQEIKQKNRNKEQAFYDNILKQQEQELQAHLVASRVNNPVGKKGKKKNKMRK